MSAPSITLTTPANTGDSFPSFPITVGGDIGNGSDIASVIVRITDLTTGLVWDSGNNAWVPGSTHYNPATSFSTIHWTFDFDPSPMHAGVFLVTAIAQNSHGEIGISPVPQKRFRINDTDTENPRIDVTVPGTSGAEFHAFPVTLAGDVSDNVAVLSVVVRISDLNSGKVWDGANGAWVSGSTTWNPATSFDQSNWTYSFAPTGMSGGRFLVTAIARDSSGNMDVTDAPQREFNVSSSIVILFDGDSTVFGAGAVHGVNDFPTQLCQGLVAGATSHHCINSGVGGARVDQLLADSPTQVDPHVAPVNMLVLWVGTNDLIQDRTAEETYANLTAYVSDRKQAGWQVAVLTLPPSVFHPSASVERVAFNNLIIANSASADLILHAHTIPELQDPSDNQFRTADGIHYFPAGYTLIADLVRPHVQNVLTASA